ncbi:MAG: 50S ribosomal protein L6 [Pseudomonadales bacterium]
MSRVANNPIPVPSGVEVQFQGQLVNVKGGKGTMEFKVHDEVEVSQQDGALQVVARNRNPKARALSGTTRAVLSNIVTGVSTGWEKRLIIQGVGYRAQAQGRTLNLQLGFSHPVEYALPEGIEVQTPTQTEVVVSGANKQLVGQVAAEIRAFRPPEPYKGKGVRYSDERVRRKEAKKK